MVSATTLAAEKQADTLNRLLRGEIAAVETYGQALERFAEGPGGLDLMQIQNHHREAVEILQEHVLNLAGQPELVSGMWGAFAAAVEGTAKLFGNQAAIKALKEGEEHGIRQYEEALQDHDLNAESRSVIRHRLLPRQRSHVRMLERMLRVEAP